MEIQIGHKYIGDKHPCFIIAEAGVNHNGDVGLAKKLVDAAKEAGADAVKFQTFKAEDVVTKEAAMAEYQERNIGKIGTQLEMIKKFELKYADFAELKNYCDKKRIIFLSTPHSEGAADFLEPLVLAYKIGSGDLTNLPFLKKIALKKKPIILSTGMATLKEVREAIDAIAKTNKKIVILHCTTEYPCPLKAVNLRAMLTIKKEFNLPVGYSDHTDNIFVPVMAVAMGARVLEKHITLDKNMPGPDHKASFNPDEFKKMTDEIRVAEEILGDGIKKITESEKNIKKFIRKSIVARKDIFKGTTIKEDMLIIKRPGMGIEPKYFYKIIGKKAKKNIKKDQLLNRRMI